MSMPHLRLIAQYLLHKHWVWVAFFALGFLAPWILFVHLAEEIWRHDGFVHDQLILGWLQARRHPTLDAGAVILSRLGGPVAMWALSLGLMGGLLVARARWQAWFVGTAMGGSWLLNLLGKALLARTRPIEWEPLVEEPIVPATVYSFPSGHAMAAAALATVLILLLWSTRWRGLACGLGLGWALAMGLARVYLGAHFPTDVLAGWVGSIGWVIGLYLLLFRACDSGNAAGPPGQPGANVAAKSPERPAY